LRADKIERVAVFVLIVSQESTLRRTLDLVADDDDGGDVEVVNGAGGN
jgi:hypothetical protein